MNLFLLDLERILHKHKKPVVASSFGKDSLVVLDLIRRINPDIEVVFNNTKVPIPETLQLKRKLKAEWNLNLVEVFPKDGWTFWQIVEKYGFPLGQRRGGAATEKCCYYLKKAPMTKAVKKYGWDLIIDGMTIYESRQRLLNIPKANYGYRYNKKWRCHKLSPIFDWKPADVWKYIRQRGLPYNKFYDYEIPEYPSLTKEGKRSRGYYRCLRVGCWCCTVGLKYDSLKLLHLRTFYPKLHNLLLQKGLGELLLEQENMEIFRPLGAEWITENRPCLFDGVTIATYLPVPKADRKGEV